jgi:multidrug efflux system outer membrane protein
MRSASAIAVAAAAAACLVAGCATPRPSAPSSRPDLPPLEFAGAGTVAPDVAIDRWWLQFDDAELHQRVTDALARNRDLSIAAARLEAARAQLDQAAGAALPAVDLSASSARSRLSEEAIAQPGSGARTTASHRLALTASHELDLWGRLRAGTDAARERLAAQAWAREAIEWSLSAQVAEAHFTQRALLRQLEVVRAVRQARGRQAEVYRVAARAGAGSELELSRAEAELASAEFDEANLSRRMLALQNSLAILIGLPLAAFDRIGLDRTPPLDPARDIAVSLPKGELSLLLARRPDLRQAESELAAAHADLAQARASTLPVVRLSGSLASDVRDLSMLFNGPGMAWSLAASLVQPLFDGGRNEARVREQAALADVALLQYQKAVAAAVLDVREAYLSLQHSSDAWAAERRRVESLGNAVRLARIGRRAGVLTQLDTLDAERNHLQAQLAEVDAYRERLLVQVQAFKALGGGHAAAASAQPHS